MALDPCATALDMTEATTEPDAPYSEAPTSGSPLEPDALLMHGGKDVEEEEEDDDDEAHDLARMQGLSSYDFRPSARDGKNVCVTTWHDIDQSGDYDPRFEGKKPDRKDGRRQNYSRRDSPTEDDGDGERDGCEHGRGGERQSNRFRLSKLAARQQGCSMVVSLQIVSEDGKALASSIPDNWPGETYNILSDEHVEKEAMGLNRDERSSRRTRRTRYYLGGAPANVGIPDPAHREPDLTGHPAARGCVSCRRYGEVCPLLSHESSWPCHLCVDHDRDCELITPPLVSAICESCRNQKIACSYVHDRSDPTQPCQHCMESGSHCVAGPGSGGIRERVYLDRDWIDPQGRKYTTCTACRSQNKKCSLRKKEDIPPCNGCLATNTPCTFEKLPVRRRKLVALSPVAISSAKTSQIANAINEEMVDDAQMINTSLCHPIEYMNNEEGRCNWCRDGSDGLHNSGFGLLGHGWEDVMVKPSAQYGDCAWDEIRGGHAAQGILNSAMCIECSMKRIQIIRCEEHELRPYTELYHQPGQKDGGFTAETLNAIDFAGPYDRLTDGTLRATDQFCDLCPSLAMFICCTIQDSDAWGTPISSELPEAEGCGLVLCEGCKISHDVFVGGEDNALDALIKAILQEKDSNVAEDDVVWHMGIRADAELLLTDGLLIRRMLAMMSAEDDEECIEGMEVD